MLPKSEIAIAQRMRSTTPQLVSPKSFSITVSNPLVEKSLQKFRPKIEAFIKQEYKTEDISMQILVAEPEVMIKNYSRPDQFRHMLKTSPSFAKLHEIFSLELA